MYCNPILAFFSLGTPEIVVIALVGLLVFGNRLPEVGKSLGRSIVEFKKGIQGVKEDVDKVSDAENEKPISK